MKKVWIGIVLFLVVLTISLGIFVQSSLSISSEGTSSEWRMQGRTLDRTAWDGGNFERISYINRVVLDVGSEVLSSAIVANGYVYVGSGDGKIYQLNASDLSQIISSFETGSSITASPIAVGNYIYVVAENGNLYKLDAQDISNNVDTFSTGSSISASPAVANGYLYLATNDGVLYKFSLSNINSVINTYNFSAEVRASITAAGDYIYVAGMDGVIYQFNSSNISRLISNYTTDGSIYSSPAVYGGKLYVGSGDGYFYQLDASNISHLLSRLDTGSPVYSSPAIRDGYVYVGSVDGTIYKLSLSDVSSVADTYSATGGIYSAPVIYNGSVYFCSSSGVIYQLSSSTMNVVSSFESNRAFEYASPAVANNYVYAGTADGRIYQLNASDLSLESIDVFAPDIDFENPTEQEDILDKPDIRINVTTVDESAISNVTVKLYNSLKMLVNQVDFFENSIYIVFYGLQSGLYYFDVSACDASGNCGVSSMRSVTVDLTKSTIAEEWKTFRFYSNRTGTDGTYFSTVPGLNRANYQTNDGVQSSPAVVDGYVYVGSNDGKVYQFSASDIGVEVASFQTGAEVYSSPTVVNGYVYVGSGDNNLYQLRASDVSEEISRFYAGSGVYSSPAVAGGYVYVGSDDGILYQLRASDVSQKIAEFATGGRILSSPTIANGFVYVGSNDGYLYQLNASNVAQVISQYNAGEWITSSPAVVGNYVYVGDNNGYLRQLSAAQVSNVIATYNVGSNIDSSPAVVGGYVYVGSNDGYLYQFSASDIGNLIAKYYIGGDVWSSPAVARGFVYVGSNDNKVYQFNASNVSKLISTYTTGAPVWSSPAVVNGYVYIGSNDGFLYQLNSSNLSRENYDATPPALTFVYPSEQNDAVIGKSYILVNVSAEDSYSDVANVTVFIYDESGILLNYLVSTRNFAFANFSYLGEGQYYINASACDTDGNCNKSQTRRVFVDVTPPVLEINYDLIGLNLSNSEIYVNLSVFDLTLSTVSVYLYDAEGNLVSTEESTEEDYVFNFSDLEDGEYSVVIEACDELGNCTSTNMDDITVDTTDPDLEFNITSGEEYDAYGNIIQGSSTISINISADDLALSNTTAYLYDASRNLISMKFSPASLSYFNFRNLPDGVYFLTASACDYSGNCKLITIKIIINTSAPEPVVIVPVNTPIAPAAAASGGGPVAENTTDNCGDWSFCLNGQQTRTCEIAGLETRACEAIGISLVDETDLTANGTSLKKKGLLASLFDINLGLVNKRVQRNGNLTVVVSLINLGVPGRVNATLYYDIRDVNNASKYKEMEIVPVETQEEFIKKLDISSLEPGTYTLLIDLTYAGQKEPAHTETEFTVYEKMTIGVYFAERIYLLVIFGIFIIAGIVFWLASRKPKTNIEIKSSELINLDVKDITPTESATPTQISSLENKNVVEGSKEIDSASVSENKKKTKTKKKKTASKKKKGK